MTETIDVINQYRVFEFVSIQVECTAPSVQYQKWKLADTLRESHFIRSRSLVVVRNCTSNNGTVILEILYQKQSSKNIFFEK